MTTEHNNRTANGYANGITERGFIIERQEKRIAELEKLISDADLCFTFCCAGDRVNSNYCKDVRERIDILLATTTNQQGE